MKKFYITIETESPVIHLKAFGSKPVKIETKADAHKIGPGDYVLKL